MDCFVASLLAMTAVRACSYRRRDAVVVAGAGGRDRQSAVGIFVQLVAQPADRDAEDVGGVGAIAEAMFQRLPGEVALGVGVGAPDHRPRNLLGGTRRPR